MKHKQNRQKIKELFHEGIAPVQMAPIVGCTLDGVYRHLLALKRQGNLDPCPRFVSLWPRIQQYQARGYSREQVVTALGIDRDELDNCIQQGRRMGEKIPTFAHDGIQRSRRLAIAVHKKGAKMGSLGAVMEAVSPEVQQWLLDQVDDSLVPLIAGIINDAYIDEQQQLPQSGTERK